MEYDFAELVRQYGVEYMEENNMYDEMPNEMEMLNEYTQYDALEAITRAFYGYRWSGVEKDEREEFNPNDEYFAFNAYGNLISIPDYWYDEYLQSFIGEDEFIEWCKEQGYIDEDDDSVDGVGLVSALQPVYDSRASFYGKAVIDESNDGTILTLISYETPVATFDRTSGVLDVFDYYSATTARHIREFARQLGIILPKGSNIKGRYNA